MTKNVLKYVYNQFRMHENGLMQVLLGNLIMVAILMIGRFFLRLLGYDDIYQAIENCFCMPSCWVDFMNKPWSILTYLLLQKGLLSILWNMLLLHTFGRMVLNFLGSRSFIFLYFFGGIVGACTVLLLYNILPRFREIHTVIYGIDSCVYAVITALTTLTPNYLIRLFLFGNIKLKHIFLILLFSAFSRLDEGSALGICQLGGVLGGYIYVKIISNRRDGPMDYLRKVFKRGHRIVIVKNQKNPK